MTVEPEELPWHEQDSGLGMANWVLLMLVVILSLFIGLGIYICVQMRRNKDTYEL